MALQSTPHSSRKGSEGTALFMVLGYLAAMTLLASVFAAALHRTLDRQNFAEKRLVAAAIAEGGLEKALVALEAHPDTYRGETGTPLGAGRFTVEVIPGDASGEYRILSEGALVYDGVALHRVEVQAVVRFKGRRLEALRWSERTVRGPTRREAAP